MKLIEKFKKIGCESTIRFRKVVEKAKLLGLVMTLDEFYIKYPPCEEWHEGKLVNIIGQECFDCIRCDIAPGACKDCCLKEGLENLKPIAKNTTFIKEKQMGRHL